MKWLQPALAGVLLATCNAALAAEPTKVWLNPGVYSHHLKRDQDYREDNYGLGAEVFVSREHGFLAGNFINSNYERSNYAGYHWRPWQWKPGGVNVGGGLVFAMIDGYSNTNNGKWFPAVLPALSAEYGPYGANLTFIPNSKNGSAVALQFRLQVW
jgi:hypothetical protein